MKESSTIFNQSSSFIGKLAEKMHHWASVIFLLLMTFVISMEVISRYVFNRGFTWSQEICELSFFLLVFLCQADTVQKGRQIRMTVFYDIFSSFWKNISTLLTIACGLFFYGILTYQLLVGISYQIEVGEGTTELMWPLWPFSLCISIGCLLTVALFIRAVVVNFFKRTQGE